MGNKITYKQFFAYSAENKKYFFTSFNDGVNLVYGKNTSGKSTLLQAILYTFGINDEKHKLKEILDEQVLFRLDLIIENESTKFKEKVSIIRNNDRLAIKREQREVPDNFYGISASNSNEHIKLKSYMADLLGCTLYLQDSKEGYAPAAIEAIFLPYYIAQDVGWIARHESFRGLDFVKNFKVDFFDYYSGICNDYDRDAKEELEKEKRALNNQICFLEKTEQSDVKIQIAKLVDESYVEQANSYIELFKSKKEELIKCEKLYIDYCNKLAFVKTQIFVLKKVKTALDKQVPGEGQCPVCYQTYPNDLASFYEYAQDKNDTEQQKIILQNKLPFIQSKINSLKNKIDDIKNNLSEKYTVMSQYKVDSLTFSDWVDHKARLKLSENILSDVKDKKDQILELDKKLVGFKTEEQIKKERKNINNEFTILFESCLMALGIGILDEEKYYQLYEAPKFFTKQGVELLKTLLAYNFAFVKLIGEVDYVHKLPFLLDAVFKEDVDMANKQRILKFINKYQIVSHQLIITIADSKENTTHVPDYNKLYFDNTANLILINETNERAFLSVYNAEHEAYLEETLAYLD